MAALAHDLPVVAVPLSADQPIHAERCRALGVGIRDMPGPGPAADALEREAVRVR